MTTIQSKEGTTIWAYGKECKYVGTEIEDADGRWNARYSNNDGYTVIHEGSNHHIYKSKITK